MQIKCKRENLTDFLILHLSMVITTTVFWLKSTLVHRFDHNKAMLRGDIIISTKHR